MAIGNPTQVGTNTSQVSTTTSLGTASACVIPANSLVVVVVVNDNAGADPGDTTSVSDGTHTYTKDATVRATAGRVTVLSFYDTAGRTATLTASYGASNMVWMYAFTVASAASTTPLDQSGSSTTTSSSALAVTTVGNVAQADEVSFGAYIRSKTDAPTTFPGAGYTSLVSATNATRVRGILVEYKNGLTAGATETAPGTLASTQGIARVIVTYKGAAAAVILAPAAINGVATVSAAVVRNRAFPASVNGVAAVSATVVRTRSFVTPSVAGAATVTATVVRTRTFAPSVQGVAAVSTSLVRIRALQPVVNGSAAVTAIFTSGSATTTQIDDQQLAVHFVVHWM